MLYKEIGKKILSRRHKNKYIIFYIANCGFSHNALTYLHNKHHKSYKITDKRLFFDEINKLGIIPSTFRTFPVIFYNGVFIGGYSDLLTFKKTG